MNYALIFAGGVGCRMNSKTKPKQFLEIHGKPILIHTIEHFDKHPEIDGICVVCVKDWLDEAQSFIEKFNVKKVKCLVAGGDSALASQYNGLKAIQEKSTPGSIVLIHDGVRPLIDEGLISKCISSVKEYGSAVTVAPAIETIIQVDSNNMITSTVSRSECQLARAPQCFFLNEILSAHEKAKASGEYDFIDSTSLMLHFGCSVHTVEGPAENIKVTTPSDFYICRALLDARENSQIYGI